MFLVTASFDSAVCLNQDEPSGPADASQTLTVSSDAAYAHHGVGEVEGLCAHGHCHHSGQYLAAFPDAPARSGPVALWRIAERAASMDSLSPPGFERPPRV